MFMIQNVEKKKRYQLNYKVKYISAHDVSLLHNK